MEPFVKHNGLVAPVDRANIDTDAIIPKQFLKRIERSGFGQYLFFEWRFDEQGNVIEDFILNKANYKGASILIARSNFGCGSSREHAPWAILDFGFKVVIASSFADIFYNNCFKNGILPIKLSDSEVDKLFVNTNKIDGYKLTIDLAANKITDENGLELTFELDEFLKDKLLRGLDDIGLTLVHENKITDFEKTHKIYQ